jgi:hypothetical protein
LPRHRHAIYNGDRSIHWNPHSKIIVTASKREKKRSKKERKKKRVEKNVMEYIANERERERVVVVVAAKTQVRIALLWVSGLHWLLLLINYYYYLFIAWDWESTTSMRLRNQISFWKWSVAVETLICLSNFLSSDLYSDCSLIFSLFSNFTLFNISSETSLWHGDECKW